MSSPPATPTNQRVRKRARSPSRTTGDLSSPLARPSASRPAASGTRNSSPDSTLPPSSPLPALDDTDDDHDVDESEIPGDLPPDTVDEDEEGEDLFAEGIEEWVSPCYFISLTILTNVIPCLSDYAPDAALDRYSDTGLDDENEFEALTAAQRRAAEMEMARRDRDGGRGRRRRAATRRRAPGFIDDDEDEDIDEEEGPLSGIIPAGVKIRTRKQYDERQDVDDAAGVDEEEEMPFEQLSDIKANSVAEWIAQPRVRKTIEKQFRHFLVTYTDDSGTSVYGERIKTLGESACRPTNLINVF